jgi:hypothetical protein
MKKFSMLLTLAAFIVGGTIFHSCQKEIQQTPEMKVENMLKGSSGSLSWNDACPGEDLVLTIGSEGNRQIQQLINGDWINIASVSGGSVPLVTTVEDVVVGDYSFRYKIGAGGFTHIVITIEPCCVTGFTYIDNEDGTYTFTLVPAEDMDDAELVFTFAQGVMVYGLDTDVWADKGVTWQAEIDLLECVTYEWIVTLTANCSGNSPQSNVWTDFTVNTVSMKADPEHKFIQVCP